MPRPKSKASVISSGRSDLVEVAAWPSRPSAVGPAIFAALPEPPVPLPKQSAFLLVGMLVVPVFSVSSAITLPLATTRRPASTFFAEATAVVETNRSRASAHAAASRNGTILGIEAALSSRVVLAGRGQVSWLPGLLGRAFPGRVEGRPSGRRPPGAPATSLTRSQWRDRAGFS